MAKRSKGRAGGGPVDAARVAAAAEALARGEAPGALTAAEAEAVCARLADEGAADALAALEARADGAARKAAKRALYRLSQRGIVPSAPPAGAEDAARAAAATARGELPVLMGPAVEDATRLFTFTLPDDGALMVVEAYFCMPDGLYRLRAAPTSAAAYGPWAREMTASRFQRVMALPERVVVPEAMVARKRWDMGRLAALSRLGPEVDRELLRRIGRRGAPPPHPAEALDLSGGQRLDGAALAARRHRILPFLHDAPRGMLEDQWREYGGESLVRGTEPTLMGSAVAAWAAQWGMADLAETLLDLAVYHHALGDLDAARTFRDAAVHEDAAAREAAMVELLREVIVAHFRGA